MRETRQVCQSFNRGFEDHLVKSGDEFREPKQHAAYHAMYAAASRAAHFHLQQQIDLNGGNSPHVVPISPDAFRCGFQGFGIAHVRKSVTEGSMSLTLGLGMGFSWHLP